MQPNANFMMKASNQAMYNLHTKRTLPREVIRWMQGLDLSYSVKDYRKDMSNGFLIGQIISRYEPGKIPMHSFQNSSNQARRDNNWTQLELFFKKNTLRGVQLSTDQYANLKNNNDPKSEQLFNFICHLYSICTKRTIPENSPLLDLPVTQNPNLTTSYLLKDEGLQKLENSSLQSNNAQLQNSGFSQKNQNRLPTRKIASNIEVGDLVDATGVGIKAEGRKMTSKRKSLNFDQQKQQSGEEEQNAEPQRLIFDYLNSIMEECLPTEDPTIREILFPDEQKFAPTQLLLRNVKSIDQEYFKSFLGQVNLNAEELSLIILRQINETWKFFIYFFKFFRAIGEGRDQFNMLCQLISNYAKQCRSKQSKRLSKVFYDALLTSMIAEVRITNDIRKKYRMMGLVYDFSGRQLQEKKSILSRLKDQINSSNLLYIQWLSVLVSEQTKGGKNDTLLLDDYVYYAQQHLNSPSVASRTSALKIFSEISSSNCSLIEKFFTSKVSMFKNCQNDPEQVYLFINIYFNILKEIVESQQYQQLFKGVGSSNLVKAYNPDNEKNIEEIKLRLNSISETIKQLCDLSVNEIIREITSKRAISFIQQSKHMMQVFLDYVYSSNRKNNFFNSVLSSYEFKSTTVEVPAVSVSAIKDYCNEILIEIIWLKTNKDYSIGQFIQLINICFDNINVKKINMEFWQDVSLHLVKNYTRLMIDLDFSKAAVEGLKKIFHIYFNYDMKIRELSLWIAEAINHYQQTFTQTRHQGKQVKNQIDANISHLNDWLNVQFHKNKNEMVAIILNQIYEHLENKENKLVYLKN